MQVPGVPKVARHLYHSCLSCPSPVRDKKNMLILIILLPSLFPDATKDLSRYVDLSRLVVSDFPISATRSLSKCSSSKILS